MSTNTTPQDSFSHKRAMRSGMASFVGTTIEFYDFYIFATAAAIVFGPLFFPEADPLLGILYSFATYAVGFFFRPLGAIIFGHVGDRFGRRRSLFLTLLLMGVATTLVGVLPTYEQAGAVATVLLVVMRAAQGLAVGGEWGGAVLMSTENAPEKFKGFYGAFPQLGNPMGALLASGVFSLLTINGNEFLLNGGWRIPFLVSAVLIAIGFWVRYSIEETVVFEKEVAQETQHEMPLKTAVKNNWRPMLLGIGLVPISTGGYYLVTTFATSYGTEPSFGIGISENLMLNVLAVAALAELLSTLVVGAVSDKIGRKRTMAITLVLNAILIIPMFLTMGPDNVVMMFVLFALFRIFMSGAWAPLSSIMSQMFHPQSRQTSLSLSYGVGNAFFGGLAPLAATALFGATGTVWSVIILYIGMSLLSLICLVLAPQRNDDHVFSENNDEHYLPQSV